MKLGVLIFLLLLVACSKAPETAPLDYALEVNDEGIFVKNLGEEVADNILINLTIHWYGEPGNGPYESEEIVLVEEDSTIEAYETIQITNITSCIPQFKLDGQEYSMFQCDMVLIADDEIFAEETHYVYFGEGPNPWEFESYLVDEDAFLQIKKFIEENFELLS